MTTLYVTPSTPRTGSGRGLRTDGIARALARQGDVHVRYVEFDGSRPDAALEADPRVSLEPLRASRGLRRAMVYGRARAAGAPPAFARGVSQELVAAGRDSRAFERIVADGPTAAAALILVAGADGVIYNAHNVESGFRTTLSTGQRDYGSPRQLRAFERNLLEGASETWLPTRRDVREAHAIAPFAACRYAPNVVDVSAIDAVSPARSGRILFVADFSYEPNLNAARYLVDDVMPAVWSSLPAAELALVGRDLEPDGISDSRIELLGFVPDLNAEYARSACAVVPLLQGGGSPLKMIEAMAYGLPVVATPLAAAGLEEALAGVHYLTGEGPAGLAAALVSACRGECDQIGLAARALAEKEYSIEALARVIP